MSHRACSCSRRAAPVALAVLLLAACGGRSSHPDTNDATPGGAAVRMDDRDGSPTQRVEELLIGRFPGVQVFRLANGGIAVRIRGSTSIMGGNEPLYVLDGQPLDDTPGGALLGVNPNDIAQIEVLKDIGSISFYGVRGANGVVLITTKAMRRK